MALVEDGALLGPRQLDMGNSGLHLLLMFPLGIGYFVFLVVSLTLGGVTIWTVIGPVVLLATLFISRWLGDLEALTAGYVNDARIRRPPSGLEGVIGDST